MRRSTLAWSLWFPLLLNTAVWGAPGKAKLKPVKPPVKPATITEIKVGWDDGGRGGIHGGAGESWTLRANGTVTHSVGVTGFEQIEEGDIHTPTTSGTFDKGDFARLAQYLQASQVFDLKLAPSQGMSSQTSISLVRGGKAQSINIPDDTATPQADLQRWVMFNLVRSITADTDWKTPAGYSINTGINGQFHNAVQDLAAGKEKYFLSPQCSVLSAAGKEVGSLQQTSPSAFFRVLLPPGTYQLALPKSANPSLPPSYALPPGYEWRAPATVQVQAGRFTRVDITIEKTPVAP